MLDRSVLLLSSFRPAGSSSVVRRDGLGRAREGGSTKSWFAGRASTMRRSEAPASLSTTNNPLTTRGVHVYEHISNGVIRSRSSTYSARAPCTLAGGNLSLD